MTNIFITSDLHFNHVKIREYCPESRGHFSSTNEMNEEIIKNWNNTISQDDHTFILGDMFMGNVQQTAVPILNRLNGTKTLILGNHDRSLMKIPGITEHFHGIYDYLCFELDKNTSVIMFHYPIQSWDGKFRGSLHCHGHCHATPTGIHGRIKDVCVDGNNMMPYNLRELAESMKQIPVHKSEK